MGSAYFRTVDGTIAGSLEDGEVFGIVRIVYKTMKRLLNCF